MRFISKPSFSKDFSLIWFLYFNQINFPIDKERNILYFSFNLIIWILEIWTKFVDSSNIFEIAQAVLETVDEYFGGLENHKDRLNYYYTEDYEESKDNKISNLKGKGAAMCVERAALSQNLLQLLGIRSFFKTSGIVKNGSNEAHSYNLIEYEGKYYIFDSTMPNMINNAPNPLIAEIDKESFDLITSPLQKIGISISTSHYNPYFSKNYEVTYDAAREKKIEVPALGNDAKQL